MKNKYGIMLLAGVFMFLFGVLANAQIVRPKEVIKNQGTNRANSKIEQGVDRGFDKIEEGVGNIFKKKKKDRWF